MAPNIDEMQVSARIVDFPSRPFLRLRKMLRKLQDHEDIIGFNPCQEISRLNFEGERMWALEFDRCSKILFSCEKMEYIFAIYENEFFEIFMRTVDADKFVNFLFLYRRKIGIYCRQVMST